MMVHFAEFAYFELENIPKAYKGYDFVRRIEVKGSVALEYYNPGKNECVFAFAGTNDIGDWLRSNAPSIATVRVVDNWSKMYADIGIGFAAYYLQILETIREYPGQR